MSIVAARGPIDLMGLWELPPAEVTALVTALYEPGQRFGRAFFYYWHELLGLPLADAHARTRRELADSATAVLSAPGDPHVHAFVRGGAPIGMFSLRPLAEHARGPEIGAVVDGAALDYAGPRAIAHAVAILDAHATLLTLKATFYAIAQLAAAAGFAHVFFFSSDPRLARIYCRFGIEFPDALRLPASRHLVGVYPVATALHVERVGEELAPVLGARA